MPKKVFKEQAIEILGILSSLDKQCDYQKEVPAANIPAELCCMWFDDFYITTDNFIRDFSKVELEAMEKFHAFYEEILLKLPKNISFEELKDCEEWLKLVREVERLLVIVIDRK